MVRVCLTALVLARVAFPVDSAHYQSAFPLSAFRARRTKPFAHEAPAPDGYGLFCYSDDLYYVCGLEAPHAYLLRDDIPHRDLGSERGSGKLLSAECAEQVQELTGADAIHGIQDLVRHLGEMQTKRDMLRVAAQETLQRVRR